MKLLITKKIKKGLKSLSAIIIAASTAVTMLPFTNGIASAEELMRLEEYAVTVDGGEYDGQSVIGAYTNGYDNQMYFSLSDLALMLNDTQAQFDFYLDSEQGAYIVAKGQPYSLAEKKKEDIQRAVEEKLKAERAAAAAENGEETENTEPETAEGDYYDEQGNLRDSEDNIKLEALVVRPDYEYLDMYMNPLIVDGMETRFYTYQLSLTKDIYMSYIDVQLMLGITISQDQYGMLNLYTDRGFEVDPEEYAEEGFFDLYNGVVLGDATTGEILFGCKENNPDAIASTSKLMTYNIVARYIELGRISMDDVVVISANVENLAYSGNGTMYMDQGQEITVRDLIGALLLASSNESALALAEYVAGSEEAFVVLMNEMADLLGLESAKFYNSNGLPVYTKSLIASVVQNYMSAADLFKLASAVLEKYPQITEFTSQTSMYLPSFDYSVSNTNYLLHNMSSIVGLKTGTTDEAGCCLVAAESVQAADGEHILVAVILGANNNIDRYQIPEVLLTYGKNLLESGSRADADEHQTAELENAVSENTAELPTETNAGELSVVVN